MDKRCDDCGYMIQGGDIESHIETGQCRGDLYKKIDSLTQENALLKAENKEMSNEPTTDDINEIKHISSTQRYKYRDSNGHWVPWEDYNILYHQAGKQIAEYSKLYSDALQHIADMDDVSDKMAAELSNEITTLAAKLEKAKKDTNRIKDYLTRLKSYCDKQPGGGLNLLNDALIDLKKIITELEKRK